MDSSSDICPPGKNVWPELVGEKGTVAVTTIEKENTNVEAVIVPDGSFVTADFRCDRVRVWVDCHGVVIRPPTIG
ncbi:hypothetical protein RND81_02G007100 [Saponaria officinalis]|uniref:Uncharacterized protein n=1 Tax=Saponaria officinalis TaxID=3572 RepID=A0AAW1MQL2_SAPOF